jgi:hypothetical protein
MKVVKIPRDELGGDRFHRFNLTPELSARLEREGLSLDRHGLPKHPWLTWYDHERQVQVFEQGERA